MGVFDCIGVCLQWPVDVVGSGLRMLSSTGKVVSVSSKEIAKNLPRDDLPRSQATITAPFLSNSTAETLDDLAISLNSKPHSVSSTDTNFSGSTVHVGTKVRIHART